MSYHSAALATFENLLGTMDHLAARAQDGNVGAKAMQAKLAKDMFPLETQFRICQNQVILALQRVWGMDIAMEEAPYETLAAAREGLARTCAHVAAAKEREAATADTAVDMTLPNGMGFVMASHEYIRDWTLPNAYFHASIAYALLRRDGLDLGKRDFLPYMMRYSRSAEG